MKVDDDGKIIDNNISVEDFTKDLAGYRQKPLEKLKP